MNSRNEDMDVRQLTQLFSFAAGGSLILLGSSAVLAGHRSHEQPTRPHMSAACSANWGFNQTCWSRFPAVQGCPASGDNSVPEGFENHPSQQMLFTPQKSLLLPDSHIVSPEYGASQAPISVFPNSAPDATHGGMPAMPSANGFPPSTTQPRQFAPLVDPAIPGSQVPRASSTLPPLPAPPLPAPGQSSLQPNLIIGPNRQMIALPVSASRSAIQTGARYGNVGRAVMPAPMFPDSYTSAQVAQSRLMPKQGQIPPAQRCPSQSPATSSAGSRYGNVGLAQPTQLPPLAIYPTILSEPLRRTP
jgi:hypothetical protein